MSRRIGLVLAVVLSVAVALGVYRFRWGVLGLAGLGPPSGACEKVEALETYLRAGGSPSAYVGRKPLIACAAQAGNYEVVARLIELDVDVNERTASHPIPIIMNEDVGFTALHFAVIEGYFEVARLLFEDGADIGLKGTISPRSPIDYTFTFNRPDILRLFLSADSATNQLNTGPVSGAGSRGYTQLFEILINKKIWLEDAYERSLIEAAADGHIELVQFLVDEGVSVNATGVNELTALHRSAREGQIEVVKILIEAGAQVDALDGDGNTPRDLAIESNNNEIVDVLTAGNAF